MEDKILITGAAGFIGSSLFKSLTKKGKTVIGLDNFDNPCGAKVKCIKGDVRDYELMDRLIKDVDIIYHLAAQINVDRSYDQGQLTYDVNVNGTKNILEACKKYGKKMLFASTSEVYGTAKTKYISESHSLNPQSPYAESKKTAEKMCVKYWKDFGVKVIILRSFNTYGPYQNKNHYGAVIPVFIKRILNNLSPEVYLPGTQTRDFMYIDDAIRAYEIAVDKGKFGDPINFGTGNEISIYNLAEKIIMLEESSFRPTYIKQRPDEVMRLRADISKSREMGFTPQVTIDQGLKRYIMWFKKNNQADAE